MYIYHLKYFRQRQMIKIRNGKLDIRTMAIMSMADAGSRMQSLVLSVMARSFTKLSRCIWYKFVPRNQR